MKVLLLYDVTETDLYGAPLRFEEGHVVLKARTLFEDAVRGPTDHHIRIFPSGGYFWPPKSGFQYYRDYDIALPEEYFRIIPDENVICPACDRDFPRLQGYASIGSDVYDTKECYSTLFLVCDFCGKKNMTAKSNLKRYGEQLCDECYNEKHHLSVVTIVPSISTPRTRRR